MDAGPVYQLDSLLQWLQKIVGTHGHSSVYKSQSHEELFMTNNGSLGREARSSGCVGGAQGSVRAVLTQSVIPCAGATAQSPHTLTSLLSGDHALLSVIMPGAKTSYLGTSWHSQGISSWNRENGASFHLGQRINRGGYSLLSQSLQNLPHQVIYQRREET